VQRIVVTGSESSGKTTLARELAAVLRVQWIPEYSRDYAESLTRTLTADDVEPIARGQMAREDQILGALSSSMIVLDTDLVSTTVYAEHYYGQCPSWIKDEARRRLGALYLLALPDLPWEADGVRDQRFARLELHAQFMARLREFGALVLEVDGFGERRLENAMAAVRGWRAARS
jgi:NadR type nicotinamide-nucleotide adenylyltransferase